LVWRPLVALEPEYCVTKIRRTFRRFFIQKMLHADDTPHRIALGVALGVFIGMTPIVGFQMIIAVAVAAMLRANKAVCVPMVWITNPVTIVPIYAGCFALGSMVLGSASAHASREHFEHILAAVEPAAFSRMLEVEYWSAILTELAQFGRELWVGCVIVGFVLGTVSYFLVRSAVSSYRNQRTERQAIKLKRRAERQRRYAKHIAARRTSV
jgi:uncharacterized protein